MKRYFSQKNRSEAGGSIKNGRNNIKSNESQALHKSNENSIIRKIYCAYEEIVVIRR